MIQLMLEQNLYILIFRQELVNMLKQLIYVQFYMFHNNTAYRKMVNF